MPALTDNVAHTEAVSAAITAGVPLTYDWYSLQSSTVTTTSFEDGGTPERVLDIYNLVNFGGAVISDDNYYRKQIPAKGYLSGTSVADLESLIDTFQAALAKRDKNLDIVYAGGTRRYTATPSRVVVTRDRRATPFADFEVDFIATSYGQDTAVTTLLAASTDTTASRTVSLTIGGSAPEQLLRTQITVTAATGLSGKTIGIQNSATGERLYVTRTWIVGDILEVDTANRTVKVNGILTDFNGAFPIFESGSQSLVIDNDFTTRTLTTTIDYSKRWL